MLIKAELNKTEAEEQDFIVKILNVESQIDLSIEDFQELKEEQVQVKNTKDELTKQESQMLNYTEKVSLEIKIKLFKLEKKISQLKTLFNTSVLKKNYSILDKLGKNHQSISLELHNI